MRILTIDAAFSDMLATRASAYTALTNISIRVDKASHSVLATVSAPRRTSREPPPSTHS